MIENETYELELLEPAGVKKLEFQWHSGKNNSLHCTSALCLCITYKNVSEKELSERLLLIEFKIFYQTSGILFVFSKKLFHVFS